MKLVQATQAQFLASLAKSGNHDRYPSTWSIEKLSLSRILLHKCQISWPHQEPMEAKSHTQHSLLVRSNLWTLIWALIKIFELSDLNDSKWVSVPGACLNSPSPQAAIWDMLNTYSGSINGLDSVMGGGWSGLEAFGGQTFGKLE